MTDLATDVAPFDVCGPLPTGVTVLEASAGTGKTYTIAALAARYVAEGTPLDQLLLVTFTRMATGELRERVRERLVSAEQGLARALAGAPPGTDDGRRAARRRPARRGPAAPPAPAARARRLRRAPRSPRPTASARRSSAASASPATSSPTPPSSRTSATCSSDVVDDLYVRRFHGRDTPDFDRAEAMRIARVAVAQPGGAASSPQDAPEDTVEAMRVRLAHAVRDELERRKRAHGAS